MKDKHVTPVLKWVGGKRQLLPEIGMLLPKKITNYCEPFVGGGAVLFDIQPQNAVINDMNQELILVYQVIKDSVDELIEELSKYKNDAETFYQVRGLDRDENKYSRLNNIERAARTIYLNKTCYNGLYRVNNAGEFNTPFGRYKNPNIVNAETLHAVSKYFNTAKISLNCGDYADVLKNLDRNSFVYLDPPYDPVSTTSSFTGYVSGGFSRNDQVRLREQCDVLDAKGIKFLASNSATDFIYDQYKNYEITPVLARRSINSKANRRGDIKEVLIRNY